MRHPTILAALAASVLFVPIRCLAIGAGTFKVQGRLTDAGGKGMTGNYLLNFRVWDSPLGGQEIWSESIYVETRSGLYTVELGKVRPLPAEARKGTIRLGASAPAGTSKKE